MAVKIKTVHEIALMKESGAILADVFESVRNHIAVGMTAEALDQFIYNEILKRNAKPSFLGYRGFKHSSCISRNEEVVHGIPTMAKRFLPGDAISVDIGVYYKGYHADAARTYAIESVDPDVERLIEITEKSFFVAIEQAKAGNHLGDIGAALQNFAESNGMGVIRDLCSHGIGSQLHEDPLIPNFGKFGQGLRLKQGMTFAIEPMLSLGTFEVLTLDDKWTIITADKKWAAHYENTIYIGPDGPEILTLK